MTERDFAGKVALVTGGSSGIGAAVVEALCKRGAAVVFCGLLDGRGEALESLLAGRGLEAQYCHADVRSDGDMARLVATCLERHGRLDLAVNNAGTSHPAARLADIPPGVYAEVMRTNADGVFFAMRHEIPAMVRGGGGAIVNVASILAQRGAPWMAAYGASKHAVLGLSLSAARDYAAAGIRVNAVLPGPVATPMLERALLDIAGDETKYAGGFPPCGPGAPGDVAEAILFLLGDEARYINGAALTVDGATSAV